MPRSNQGATMCQVQKGTNPSTSGGDLAVQAYPRCPDITCTTFTADMARRVWHIQETAESIWDIADMMRFLLYATREAVEVPEMGRICNCAGALHLSKDEIDIAREPSHTAGHPAGYLDRRESACKGTRCCILIATPWPATWSDSSVGQVSLSVRSVRTVDGT